MTSGRFGRFGWGIAMLVMLGCRGPEVGPPRALSETICEDYCAEGRSCDQDCVHACEIGRTACPAEWDAALECAMPDAACDAAEHLPRTTACTMEFDGAYDCSPAARCALEDTADGCEDCCIGADREGWNAWSEAFARCVCGTCSEACGTTYCSMDTGSDLECVSCYEAYCLQAVTRECDGDVPCLRYDACIQSCPTDGSSHCSEHPTFDACETCCLVEFVDGASQWVTIFNGCGCETCSECSDEDVCGEDAATTAACEACIDRECTPRIRDECGAMPECNAFKTCYEACPL